MQKKSHVIGGAPAALGAYSHAAEAGGMFFLSGQLGIDPNTGNLANGGVEGETERAMENIGVILRGLQLDFSNVVKSVIYFTDVEDFGKINGIYGRYFKENFPARSAAVVSKLVKNAKVEIEVIAAR
ncbi:MAG: Rid family detoxifying hydrolase [Rickettsiales bacterium]|jgi:2-iminobutanoate/2-iminopropanoate deaminase|nr:Rid family detoxifying hydrolase [Rickettsiales bacterium]